MRRNCWDGSWDGAIAVAAIFGQLVAGFLLLLALATIIHDMQDLVLLSAVLVVILLAGRALWRRV